MLFLTPSPLLYFSLSVTNISNPFLRPCQHPKSDKVFPDKWFVKMCSVVSTCVFITQYPTPEFHFRTVKWKIIDNLNFMTSGRRQNLCQLIFDWNRLDFFLEVFWKSPCRYSVNILRGVLQNCLNELLKILRGVLQKYWRWPQKSNARCFVKGVLKTCWVFCKTTKNVLKNTENCSAKYWYVVCRNTEKCSVRIFENVLWKYWVGCSAKILKSVQQNCWEEFQTLTQMIKFLLKAQGLGQFSVISWPSILGGQDIISNYWEQGHLQIFYTY